MMWFRQMAQLSTTMSQAQRDTAFHYSTLVNTALGGRGGGDLGRTFFTSNFFLPSMLLPLAASAFLATGASLISTSAMMCGGRFSRGWDGRSSITERGGWSLESSTRLDARDTGGQQENNFGGYAGRRRRADEADLCGCGRGIRWSTLVECMPMCAWRCQKTGAWERES